MTDAHMQMCVYSWSVSPDANNDSYPTYGRGVYIYILLSLTCPCWSLYSHIVPLLQYGFFHLLYKRKNLSPVILPIYVPFMFSSRLNIFLTGLQFLIYEELTLCKIKNKKHSNWHTSPSQCREDTLHTKENL
jgi:hypothetical protein